MKSVFAAFRADSGEEKVTRVGSGFLTAPHDNLLRAYRASGNFDWCAEPFIDALCHNLRARYAFDVMAYKT